MVTLSDERPFLTVAEVADLIGVSPMRTYQLVGEGIIPAIRVGSRIRIPRRAFGHWIEQLNDRALDAAGIAHPTPQAAGAA